MAKSSIPSPDEALAGMAKQGRTPMNKDGIGFTSPSASPKAGTLIKKKGAQFPQAIIQYAATLAAKNSKAKTQQVVPVIVVARKFVSKPKNAAPGEVTLQKEEIVDAFIGE